MKKKFIKKNYTTKLEEEKENPSVYLLPDKGKKRKDQK